MPRAFQWVTNYSVISGLAANSSIRIQLDSFLSQRAGATLTRFIGALEWGPAAAALRTRISLGIALVSEPAFAAGTGSLPSPVGPDQVDWCYWSVTEQFLLGVADGQSRQRYPIDVRGQRRYGNRDMILTAIVHNAVGGSSVNGVLSWRALLRLG